MTLQPLIDFARERGGFGTDDVLASLLPLFRQVADVHERGLVAPLRGIESLSADDQSRVGFDPALARPPQRNVAELERIGRPSESAVEVIGRTKTHLDLAAGNADVRSLDVAEAGEPIVRPVLAPAWERWEHRVGHHDELTDIGSLGELLAALAAGLDLARLDAVELLARGRSNLFAIAPSIHPIVAQVVASMVEPDRHRRSQDLRTIIERLETYRDQPLDLDLAAIGRDASAADRRQAILAVLRDRLFDLSRRNRLVWFRPSQQSLNLTEASVPLLLDARNIRPEHLFTWQARVADRVLSGRPVSLGSVVRWEDAPYANATLDTLISQARRDRSEYGQAQLRLVIAFLRWHDLKGERTERISSPLLLLPVALTKKRGVRDSYVIQAESTEAEVNPALRQLLRQLYDLDLPPTLDFATSSIEDLHRELEAAIHRSEPAVELRLVEKPRIEVIHHRALIRLESFQRRAGRGNVTLGRRAYAYSYRRRDFRPLGLQIFLDRVAPRPAPMSLLLGGLPAVRTPGIGGAIGVAVGVAKVGAKAALGREQEFYALDEEGSDNPYHWDVDLCALTLANVNYRTMTLVRDYRELAADGRPSQAFDRIFALEPRPLDTPPGDLPLDERWLVVPADGSQIAAMAKARGGESLVIQGPPGTGKSQTITNLIADYVARGKRVLFVCQKRAAIDVVHARLRQRGLDELACLIHDAQADKKAFVQGLRGTYEAWLADDGGRSEDVEQVRARVLAELSTALHHVERYEAALGSTPTGGPSLRILVERLIGLRERLTLPDLPPAERRILPGPASWWAARNVVDRVVTAFTASGAPAILATSPLRHLAPELLDAPRPEAEVAFRAGTLVDTMGRLLDRVAELETVAGRSEPPAGRGRVVEAPPTSLATLVAASELGAFVLPLARRDRAGVLRRSSPELETLRRDAKSQKQAQALAAKTAKAAAAWREPLAPDDARAALAVARARERSFLRFLDGDWRRVSAAVKRGFDIGFRAVRIPASQALAWLVDAQDAEAAVATGVAESEEAWGYADAQELSARVDELRRADDPTPVHWRDRLANAPGDRLATALVDLGPELETAREALGALLTDVDDVPIADLAALVDTLASPAHAGLVRAAAPALRDLNDHDAVAHALRRLALAPDAIEALICAAAVEEAIARAPELGRFDGPRLAELVSRIGQLLPALYQADAATIVGRLRSRFLDEVAHSALSVTGMTPLERGRKKTWATGRRELENEFRKVMRYRSIRDLASGDPGAVVAALRPIWLMSPTSVSDTLPLDPDLFDVVIYDEASQIPIEAAVPAMHRAHQVIVVGDRMQLPPTQFFTARSELADDPDDDQEVGVVLDGDSFLSQSAGRLPSTMLTWHYRSRFEALIGFSNAAFYDARLATIPDRRPGGERLREISVPVEGSVVSGDAVVDEAVAAAAVDAILERPISLHRLRGSVYTRRTNPAEAAYLAGVVRELLRRETGLTIGIVAFSEAQQGEIERALEALADVDAAFATRYEQELVREDDDQVVGLFVKNLENVQGDERDVILMSVCYGPDADGRMIMNFGPINQDGGEKRLNVIFSRARERMAIVSSIDADAITNTYNDGANTLRRFLQYAAAVSRGEPAAAATVLSTFGERRRRGVDAARAPESSTVVRQLAGALRARGIEVVEDVGQSAFRCDLALRRPGDDEHRVAVLVDHEARVAAQPLAERLLSHPGVLAMAGWRVAHVLTMDWVESPERVVEYLERVLAEAIALSEAAEADAEAARAAATVDAEAARAAATVDAVRVAAADEVTPSASTVADILFPDGDAPERREPSADDPGLEAPPPDDADRWIRRVRDAGAGPTPVAATVRWTGQLGGTGGNRAYFGRDGRVAYLTDGYGVTPHVRLRAVAVATGRELGTVVTGTLIRCVAWLDDRLLAASDSKLFELDPTSLAVVRRWDQRVPRYSESIAVVGGTAVLATWTGPTVSLMDLASGSVRRKQWASMPVVLQAGDTALLVNGMAGRVARIDVPAARLKPLVETPRVRHAGFAAGAAWILEGTPKLGRDALVDAGPASRRMLRLDLGTRQETQVIDLPIEAEIVDGGHEAVACRSREGSSVVIVSAVGGAVISWRGPEDQRVIGCDPDHGIVMTTERGWDRHGRQSVTCWALDAPVAG